MLTSHGDGSGNSDLIDIDMTELSCLTLITFFYFTNAVTEKVGNAQKQMYDILHLSSNP